MGPYFLKDGLFFWTLWIPASLIRIKHLTYMLYIQYFINYSILKLNMLFNILRSFTILDHKRSRIIHMLRTNKNKFFILLVYQVFGPSNLSIYHPFNLDTWIFDFAFEPSPLSATIKAYLASQWTITHLLNHQASRKKFPRTANIRDQEINSIFSAFQFSFARINKHT